MLKIKFLGATRTVTGSCYLLETGKRRVLVDCGMYHGEEFEDRNYLPFEFDPRSLDFVLLTHAHLDHCGLLPKLYREGFRGKVYLTPPTRYIVEYMLLDSAKVQQFRSRESKQKNRRWELVKSKKYRKRDKNSFKEPIYDTKDVIGILRNLKVVRFGEKVKRGGDLTFKFLRVGHALGAASIWVRIDGRELVFSGDMGNSQQVLDSRFDYPKSADYVIMESLYGGIEHEDRKKEENSFLDIIKRATEKGGNIIIPSFTLQRTQEILCVLKRFFQQGRINENVLVYLDSPLAMRITEVYKKYYSYLNPAIIKNLKGGHELFSRRNFVFIKSNAQSKKIRKRRGSIIIAGHGMCAGGRVIYHLMNNLSDKRSSIVFIGFQAEGTLGREIIDGAKEVFIEDNRVKVKANIVKLSTFSAHAHHSDLLKWLRSFDKKQLKKIFLVHAEEERSIKFARILKKQGYNAVVPEWKKEYILNF